MDGRNGPSSAYRVAVYFSRCGIVVLVGLLAIQSACSSARKVRVVAVHLSRLLVGVGLLLATLSEQPKEHSNQRKTNGNAHCAANNQAKIRV